MPANSAATRYRRMMICGGYGAIAVAFVLLCAVPYVRNVTRIRAQIVQEQREIDSRKAARQQLEQVRGQVHFIGLQVANHDRLLPETQNVGEFMEKLSNERDAAGMKDGSVHSLPVISLQRCQQLPIEISGTCTFSQFHDFLVRLEGMERMSSVSKLSVDADTAMSGAVNVSLQLSIYNTKPAPQ
ncbi:MAG: type 4a pilus biogenesis protein PilO [Phycisphaerae bacterium]